MGYLRPYLHYTIDAIATNPEIAKAVTDAKADYLLALKSNQPTLHAEVEAYFADAPRGEMETAETIDKDHGRIETRKTSVSRNVRWLLANEDRRYPGHPRFPSLTSLVRTVTRTEHRGKITEQTRYFISSAALTADRAAQAVRAHWGIESFHWVLDVVFREDLSRLRRGHGAHNMALVRRFAFNILRKGKGQRSIKTARKAAGWSPDFLASLLPLPPVNLTGAVERRALLPAAPFHLKQSDAAESGASAAVRTAPLIERPVAGIGGAENAKLCGACRPGRALRSAGGGFRPARAGPADKKAGAGVGGPCIAVQLAFRDHGLWLGH